MKKYFSITMLFRVYLSCFFFLAVLFIASCSYKLKDEYFRDLAPGSDPPMVTISIDGEGDSLLLTSHHTYNVRVNAGSRHCLFYRLYINDVEESFQQASGDQFSIDPLNSINQNGLYKLTIEVAINSGTGSIGDKTGAEGYLVRKDFSLFVLINPNAFNPVLHFATENGRLKITLDVPPDIENVRKIIISKSVIVSDPEPLATVYGTSHFVYYDPTYVGESAYYYIQVFLGDPSGTVYYPLCEGSSYCGGDPGQLSVTSSARGFPLLKWTKNRYFSNFGSYRIYMTQTGHSGYQLVSTVNNLSDTIFESVGAPLGPYLDYRVASVPLQLPSFYNDEVAIDYYSGNSAGTYTGIPSFYFSYLKPTGGQYLYYGQSSDWIFQYSSETNRNTDSIRTTSGWFYTYAISPNDKFILAATGASNFSYLFYNLVTRDVLLVPSSQVIGTGVSTGIISIADNGIAAICAGNNIIVYDFIQQKLIVQKTFQGQTGRTVISSDASWLFVETKDLYLFRIESDNLVQEWSSAGSANTFTYYGFVPTDPGKADIVSGNTLYTKNCEGWTTLNSVALGASEFCNIDHYTGRILVLGDNSLRILDYQEGSQLFENPTSSSVTTDEIRFKNKSVYFYAGKRLIIF